MSKYIYNRRWVANTLKLALHHGDPLPAARPEVQRLEEMKPEFASSSGDDSGADVGVSGSGYGAALPLSSPLQMTE